MTRRFSVLFALAVLLACPRVLFAQSTSGWGVQATFAPRWTIPSSVAPFFGDELVVEGDELRVGFVRGRTLSGDWGLSYVRKRITDGSYVTSDQTTRYARNLIVHGVSLDKFVPFGTIKERVQLGLGFGIGAGWSRGEVLEADAFSGQLYTVEPSSFITPYGLELPVMPLAHLEATGAYIVAGGLKLKVSAGVNYPGVVRFTVGGLYLFGGRR
jgi:hypothetical protein